MLIFCLGSAKAQYVINEADAAYEVFNFQKAIDLYEQAYKKKPTLHAAERLGSCYQMNQNYREAESWYAIAVGMQGSPARNRLNYAMALQNNNKYQEAKKQYEKYADLESSVTTVQRTVWLASCDAAMRWMNEPVPVLIVNQEVLNSKMSDWGWIPYQTGGIFSSDRLDNQKDQVKNGKPFLKFDGARKPDPKIYGWTGNGYLSLFEQKGENEQVTPFPLSPDRGIHIAVTSTAADESELYFTMTPIPEKPNYKNGLLTINVGIYSSKKDKLGNWMKPVPFPYNDLSRYSMGDPFLTHDGKKLYFVSNMPGGKGGMDIYYTIRTENGGWAKPVNADEFNSEGNERCPVMDQGGNFYFSSDGRIGMGGLDVYYAKMTTSGTALIENMGYPINSPQDDFSFRPDGEYTGYFASNRPGGLGNDDIYRIIKQRPKMQLLAGIAYEKGTADPLSEAIVTLTKTGGANMKVQTAADGKFQFNVEAHSAYGLRGDKTGFRADSAQIEISDAEVIRKDLYLEKITIDLAIKIENIYYDFDQSKIRPDAAIELDKLVSIMSDNPTIWIELSSHTDSRGAGPYNKKLSQRRADAAVEYLINQGINKNRLIAKGYGANLLLNHCGKGVKCTEAEHQQNRRTEFRIIKY